MIYTNNANSLMSLFQSIASNTNAQIRWNHVNNVNTAMNYIDDQRFRDNSIRADMLISNMGDGSMMEHKDKKQPRIEKVEVYNEKVVKCTFSDGKWEKAVCSGNDEFELETGILICIAKHIMGGQSKLYSQVRKGVKLYHEQLEREAETWRKKVATEKRREKKQEKRKAKQDRIIHAIAEIVRESR